MSDRTRLEETLPAWLRSRDAGPAPESLRIRLSHVTEARDENPSRLILLVGVAARVAAVAAALAFVAVALSFRPGDPAPDPGRGTQVPGQWPAPEQPLVQFGAVLVAVAILSGVGLAALVAVTWRDLVAWRPPRPHRPSRRTALMSVAAVVVAIAVAVPLNVAGFAVYPGGPICTTVYETCDAPWLRPPESAGPRREFYTRDLPVGQQGGVNLGGYLRNDSPIPLTIERVTPRVSDSGFVIDAVEIGPGDTNGPSDHWPSPPLDVPASAAYRHLDVIVSYHATTPGTHWFSGLEIEYRAGPIRFRTVVPLAATVCATPLPSGHSCPAQWSLP